MKVPGTTRSAKSGDRPYRVCRRCIMDTTDPDIVFDAAGVCNHCHQYDESIRLHTLTGPSASAKVQEIVAMCKRDGEGRKYDCVLGVSGGVDSTFVAYKVKQLGLRPLAVHVDNGWDSELAVKNIEHICRKLEVDLHTIVLDWEEFRDLQLSFIKSGTPDWEIPSDHAIAAGMLQTAKLHGVAHIITGYNARTESHLPAAWSQGHADWRYLRSVHTRFGSRRLSGFPRLPFSFMLLPRYPRWIDILNYLDYSKKEAMPFLERELGWRYYGGKHYESIYTRFYQGYVLPKRFGYDKRLAHLSSLICSGEISRDEALAEREQEAYSAELQKEDLAYFLKKLGLSADEFDRLMAIPKRTMWDYPSYAKVRRSPLWGVVRAVGRCVAAGRRN